MGDCSYMAGQQASSWPTKCQEVPLIIVATKNNLVKVHNASGGDVVPWKTTDEWDLTKLPPREGSFAIYWVNVAT